MPRYPPVVCTKPSCKELTYKLSFGKNEDGKSVRVQVPYRYCPKHGPVKE